MTTFSGTSTAAALAAAASALEALAGVFLIGGDTEVPAPLFPFPPKRLSA